MFHLMWSNPHSGSRILDLFNQVRIAGFCGVNLFFALSGFLITGILLDSLNAASYFKTFYARRSLRIFPLYYGFIFLLLLLTKPLHFVWSGWQYYFLTYSANLALWRSSVPLVLHNFNINHFWSLQVEEQFYLAWPLVVYRVRRPERLAGIAIAGCALVLCTRIFLVAMQSHPAFNNKYLPYSPTFSCADNLLFGCGLCAVLRTNWRTKILRIAPAIFAACLLACIVIAVVNHTAEWDEGATAATRGLMPTVGFTFIGLGSAALIALSLRTGMVQSVFRNFILRFFGKYSYGLYVYHYSLDEALKAPLRTWLYGHIHSKGMSVILEALLVGALSVFIAVLSYHLYEVQFLRLKRFFEYNRGLPHKPAVAAG